MTCPQFSTLTVYHDSVTCSIFFLYIRLAIWVGLPLILVVPPFAQFCFGLMGMAEAVVQLG